MAVDTNEPYVLEFEGEIDLHEAPRIKEQISKGIAKKPAKLVVDLSKVTYIDSSGLAALIDGLQRAQAYGGKLVLAGIHNHVRTIFQISRLDKVFSIFPDRESALLA